MVWGGALVKDYRAHILKQVTLPLRSYPLPLWQVVDDAACLFILFEPSWSGFVYVGPLW